MKRCLFNILFTYIKKYLLICLLVFPLSSQADESVYHNTWQSLTSDLEVYHYHIESMFPAELALFRTSLTEYRLAVIRTADFGFQHSNVKQIGQLAKSSLIINANFFDTDGKALGLVISRGIKYHNVHYGGSTLTGIFQLTKDGPEIIHRSAFKPHFVIEAIQAGPRLIDYLPTRINKSDDLAKRAGICLDSQHRTIFFVSTGLIGITLKQLQTILSTKDIDCIQALNLDGGGSAQLYYHDKQIANNDIFIQGRDDVPIMLGLFKKN